jgi:hypothetical protein
VTAVLELVIDGAVSKYAVTVGLVKVLLVKVSDPANVANVPVVGKVTLVAAVTVNVVVYAPDVVNDPPNVMVFEPLLTPVPPYVAPIKVPFQTPVAIVPTDVKLDVTTVEFNVVPVNVPAAAVTVPDPPKLMAVPLTVTDELANWALVTVPDNAVVGTVVDAVMADVPLP